MDLARNLIQRVNIGDSLTRSAAARPDHPAVVEGVASDIDQSHHRCVVGMDAPRGVRTVLTLG